ncbi:hypothetical protein [Paenibacillus oleatilyticus]|uniref:hypothetical protein n=1 Tax=Paenibacillus oleatilyticus TaxID=2594886 RepID=UPI001C1FB3EC|nr:hypothetical protein [Paenibacillus oleatilyticus]MBU7316037.1 hypothetical protein [Paenibacillus oleatilyticus]
MEISGRFADLIRDACILLNRTYIFSNRGLEKNVLDLSRIQTKMGGVIFLKKLSKVLLSTVLTLAVSVPTLVSAEKVSPQNERNIPVYFANNAENNLSPEDISKITSQLGPTAKSVTIVDSMPVANKSKDISPMGNVCEPGDQFLDATPNGTFIFKKGREGTRYVNKTGSSLTYTSTFTEQYGLSGEINGEGKFDWGPIEAKVGFKIGGSITWVESEASTITIRPHYQGWNDYGSLVDYWSGYYAYVYNDCSTGSKRFISVMGPRQKAVVANEVWANY